MHAREWYLCLFLRPFSVFLKPFSVFETFLCLWNLSLFLKPFFVFETFLCFWNHSPLLKPFSACFWSLSLFLKPFSVFETFLCIWNLFLFLKPLWRFEIFMNVWHHYGHHCGHLKSSLENIWDLYECLKPLYIQNETFSLFWNLSVHESLLILMAAHSLALARYVIRKWKHRSLHHAGFAYYFLLLL